MSVKTEYDGSFKTAFKIVVGHEGGYVNDPNDLGGETKFGISKKSYPHLNISEITLQDAERIYYQDYWVRLHENDPRLKLICFDGAVNQGLNFMNSVSDKLNSYSMLTEQGRLTMLYVERKNRYNKIVELRPSNIKYLNGWMNRLENIYSLNQNYINKSKADV